MVMNINIINMYKVSQKRIHLCTSQIKITYVQNQRDFYNQNFGGVYLISDNSLQNKSCSSFLFLMVGAVC